MIRTPLTTRLGLMLASLLCCSVFFFCYITLSTTPGPSSHSTTIPTQQHPSTTPTKNATKSDWNKELPPPALQTTKRQSESTGLKFSLGNYHCNRYQSHPTLFASCNLESVCITTGGSFVLFHPHERLSQGKQEYIDLLNSRAWVYNQGRHETGRGNHFMKIVDGDLMFDYSNGQIRASVVKMPLNYSVTEKEKVLRTTFESGSPQTLHENFVYYTKPVYGLKRYASGNMGHFIFENIMLPFANLANHKPTDTSEDIERALDNHILYLDDLFDNSTDNKISIYEYDKLVATQFSMEVSKVMSKNKVLQLCNTNEYYTVESLPCPQEKPSSSPKGDPTVLHACFSSLILGMTKDIFFDRDGRENLFVSYRQFAYHSLGIHPLPSAEDNDHEIVTYLSKKPIKIAIHKKSFQSHFGRTIANTLELKQSLEQHLKEDMYIQTYHPNQEINVEVFEFKTMTPLEQIKFFSDVDVYITDQGSSAYYAVYLRKDTTIIIAPECTGRRGCRTPLGVEKLIQLSNARVLDYMELLPKGETVQCTKRPTNGFLDNCDGILSTALMNDIALRGIKARYRQLVQSKLNDIS